MDGSQELKSENDKIDTFNYRLPARIMTSNGEHQKLIFKLILIGLIPLFVLVLAVDFIDVGLGAYNVMPNTKFLLTITGLCFGIIFGLLLLAYIIEVTLVQNPHHDSARIQMINELLTLYGVLPIPIIFFAAVGIIIDDEWLFWQELWIIWIGLFTIAGITLYGLIPIDRVRFRSYIIQVLGVSILYIGAIGLQWTLGCYKKTTTIFGEEVYTPSPLLDILNFFFKILICGYLIYLIYTRDKFVSEKKKDKSMTGTIYLFCFTGFSIVASIIIALTGLGDSLVISMSWYVIPFCCLVLPLALLPASQFRSKQLPATVVKGPYFTFGLSDIRAARLEKINQKYQKKPPNDEEDKHREENAISS